MDKYTIDNILGTPQIVSAVIDRIMVTNDNDKFWIKFLTFEQTKERIFRSLYGTKTMARMGSVVEKNAQAPLRGRKGLGQATLEVIPMKDRMQMDNERLDILRDMIERLNANNSADSVNDVVNFLSEDLNELIFAPHKRMDKIIGDLLSKGVSTIDISNNPNGVSTIDMELPILSSQTSSSNKGKMMQYLIGLLAEYEHLSFGKILMNQNTFFNRFATSDEFVGTVKKTIGSNQITPSGVASLEGINAIFSSFGLPTIELVNYVVSDVNGAKSKVFADDRMTFIPNGQLGKMRYHIPYELTDKVPGKVYTEREGGMFVSTQRTDEGRFIEYCAEWVPEIRVPKSILNVQLSGLD